jgi:hypothetical protein
MIIFKKMQRSYLIPTKNLYKSPHLAHISKSTTRRIKPKPHISLLALDCTVFLESSDTSSTSSQLHSLTLPGEPSVDITPITVESQALSALCATAAKYCNWSPVIMDFLLSCLAENGHLGLMVNALR